MYLKKKALWLIANARGMFCASAEVDFRATFKQYFRGSNRDFSIVYARVNASQKFSEDFNIHLNILQYETTIKLKCLEDRPEQTVDPYVLAKEIKEYIRFRDNRLGMAVLAIDRVHKLTPAQQSLLINFFTHNLFPFSTMFIIPQQEWDRWDFDDFRSSVRSMDTSFRSLKDIGKFFKERSKGIVFDQDGNFIKDTFWDK